MTIASFALQENITARRAPRLSASVEPAVSSRTKEINERVRALQKAPSPGSLSQGNSGKPQGKSLEEQFFEALSQAKVLTSQVAMHLDTGWRARLFGQLDSLHDPAEWEQGDHPLQKSSFSTFLRAILELRPERRPGLGLSHAGHLIAAWTTGRDRLTIEFLPDNRTRWVLSVNLDEGTARYAGDAPVARLKEDLAGHNPEHWFSHGAKSHEPP